MQEMSEMSDDLEPRRSGHPNEWAVGGFLAGVANVLVVPGLLLGLIHNFWAQARFNMLTLGLATLLVPVALLVPRRTRGFAEAMVLGGAVTAFAVGAVLFVFWRLLES